MPVDESLPWHNAEQAARSLVHFWARGCDDFLHWQRKTFIEKEPSRAQLSEHSRTLKLMLRCAVMMQAQASDPDFPARDLLPEIAGRLRLLQESRTLIHNPMTDKEADEILGRAFPDESRAGIAA